MMGAIRMRAGSRLFLLLAGAAALLTTSPALANGFGESRPWQFRTTADRANNTVALDMILREQGGYYDGFNTYNTNNTYFAGDQVNCNVSASATGNAGSNHAEASVGNANSSAGVSNEATTIGNQADNTVNGVPGAGGNSVAFGYILNGGGPNGATYNTEDLIDNDQGNYGSNLGSEASGNTAVVSTGSATGGGASTQTNINDQTNTGDQYASIENSTACAFNQHTGNGGAS